MKRLLLSLVLLASAQVQAQCAVVATTPASFGSISSIQVSNAIQSTLTLNAGLQCSGSLLSVLASNDHFYATFTPVGATSGLVGPTGDVINYTLYANDSSNFAITRGQAFDFARNGIIDALGLLNSTAPKKVPIYLKSLKGSNVAAGLYQETLAVKWDINYCYGIGALNLCLGRQILKETTNLTISLLVTNDCQIDMLPINFGVAPLISSFSTVNQSISVSCTKGSRYTVGLGDGQYLANGRRRMKSADNRYLAYDIFKSASALRWGALASDRRASSDADVNPGTGSGTGSQVFNYNARVYPDQATPPAGTYVDSVILDVQF